MDVRVNSQSLFALADAIGAAVEYDHKSGKISGAVERAVKFGDLSVNFGLKIVSSHATNAACMVMAKVVGNLGMFIAVKQVKTTEVVDLYLLNLAKMDRLDGWLEQRKPQSVNEVLKLLDKAKVRGFVKIAKNKWNEAA